MKDEDASESDIQGLAILIRCLGVNFQIMLHFASDEKIRPLSAAFQKYEDHLCKLYSAYTWESVRSVHLNFHKMAVNDGVDVPDNRSRIGTSIQIPSALNETNLSTAAIQSDSKLQKTSKATRFAFATSRDVNTWKDASIGTSANTAGEAIQPRIVPSINSPLAPHLSSGDEHD